MSDRDTDLKALRDRFAELAMPVLLTDLFAWAGKNGRTLSSEHFDELAQASYGIADRMLKRRDYDFKDEAVTALELPDRIVKSLKAGGVTTVGELIAYSAHDLTGFPGMRKTWVTYIINGLSRHGGRLAEAEGSAA